jgi:hypothetical protein
MCMSFVLPQRMSHLQSAILHGMVFRTSEDDNNDFVLCPPGVTEKHSGVLHRFFSVWSNLRSSWFHGLIYPLWLLFFVQPQWFVPFLFPGSYYTMWSSRRTFGPISNSVPAKLTLIFTCVLRPFFVSYYRFLLNGFQLPTAIPPFPLLFKDQMRIRDNFVLGMKQMKKWIWTDV